MHTMIDGALNRKRTMMKWKSAAAVFTAYGISNLGMQFFPGVEPEGGNIIVRGYGDLSIREKDSLMREVEGALLEMPEIETLYVRTGGHNRIGRIRYDLIDWQQRRKAKEIIEEMKQRTAHISGMEIEISKDESGIGHGKDLQIELNSKFPEKLDAAAKKIRQALEANDKLVDVEDSRPKPGIEWQLHVDRANAARYDADSALVGSMVQMLTNGLKVGEYRPDDVDIDTYNVLRRKSTDAMDAILRTGAQRLRPVLLTTVTTILGLLPMVLEINIDLLGRNIEFGGPSTQWWSQLATAVAGGLAFATLLTLVVTPCLLALAARRQAVSPRTEPEQLTSAA